jgi:hypothetical protein
MSKTRGQAVLPVVLVAIAVAAPFAIQAIKGGPLFNPARIPVTRVTGAYCPRAGDEYYTLRYTLRNDGNRPVRTVYSTIKVYDKAGKLTTLGAVDYPVYSVPATDPGIAPGETYEFKLSEGLVIPIRIGSPDSPGRVTSGRMWGTEASIK